MVFVLYVYVTIDAQPPKQIEIEILYNIMILHNIWYELST